MRSWSPFFGAQFAGEQTNFRIWAPAHRKVAVVIDGRSQPESLHCTANGVWEGAISRVQVGDRYRFVLDGASFPDPAARFMPDGVHKAGSIVDPSAFSWTDQAWRGRSLDQLVIYELHVGTFTPEGSYRGVLEKLPYLVELGVTCIELLPVNDFPGSRNWGYDGVALYAPARCYGTPDDLRLLVDQAHAHGIAVLLDVVYNHFGPDGNYLHACNPEFFAEAGTRWGAAPDFAKPLVRRFLIDNALYWLHEFHFDGLRLDATDAIQDPSEVHFLAELNHRVRCEGPQDRTIALIAEDGRNLDILIRPIAQGGYGLDAVWADDWHRQIHRHLTGEDEGYFREVTGTIVDLATTIRQGWFYTGQPSVRTGEALGTDPIGLRPEQMIVYLQNHDQVGNRAFGERLHHLIDLDRWHAASVLLLALPQTPLIFMGQEWAATTPFRFFTDHHPTLGQAVTLGRRREFREFCAFRDAESSEQIPDPQAEPTFEKSRLNWSERAIGRHHECFELYCRLLRWRREWLPRLRRDAFSVNAVADEVRVRYPIVGGGEIVIQACLVPGGACERIRGEVLLGTANARIMRC